jgi:hypothetical protein
VHGDVAHAQLARLLDERDADVVVEEEARRAARAPLRVGLERRHLVLLGEHVHRFHVARLVRIDAPVDVHAVSAGHALDDCRGGGRFLDGERLVFARRRHERQHDQVRIRVQEHVLDERVAADALHRSKSRLVDGAATRPIGREAQRLRARRQVLRPGPGRVHEVALHVEDELALVKRAAREHVVERRFAGKIVEAAACALRGERGVERKQRARGAACRHQELPARLAGSLRIACRILERTRARPVVHRRKRNRRELAVGRRVELDRQAPPVGIVTHVRLLQATAGSGTACVARY